MAAGDRAFVGMVVAPPGRLGARVPRRLHCRVARAERVTRSRLVIWAELVVATLDAPVDHVRPGQLGRCFRGSHCGPRSLRAAARANVARIGPRARSNGGMRQHRLVALSCRELAVCQGNRLHMNAAATARARGSRSASSPDVVLAELGETAWGKRPPGQSFPTAAVRPSTDRTTNDRFVPDGAA